VQGVDVKDCQCLRHTLDLISSPFLQLPVPRAAFPSSNMLNKLVSRLLPRLSVYNSCQSLNDPFQDRPRTSGHTHASSAVSQTSISILGNYESKARPITVYSEYRSVRDLLRVFVFPTLVKGQAILQNQIYSVIQNYKENK
jgi:hypothetical protein